MTKNKKDILQPIDDSARRLSKPLVRTARYAAPATIDLSDGAPSVSRVAMDGAPVFLISRLSSHFTNLKVDRRCSLLVGEPGKGSPLAYPRMTLIEIAERLAAGSERAYPKSRLHFVPEKLRDVMRQVGKKGPREVHEARQD